MAPSVSQDVARAGQRGLTGAIRRLWPGESAAFRDHLLRLDPESRRSRFGAPVAPCFVERYAARAVSPKSIVYGYVVDGTVRAAAELRPAAHPFSAEAEAALSVERDWQDRGVGSALLERVILAAQNRGIRTVRLNCLVNNFRMRALAKKYEAVLRFRAGDVVGELANPTATPLSLLRESVAEWNGIAATILDWQMRALRAA